MSHQMPLPNFEQHRFVAQAHTRKALGTAGELAVCEQLRKQGYHVTYQPKGKHYDLLVKDPDSGQLWGVEVKTARAAKDKKWRYTLLKQGSQYHLDANIVILLAVDADRFLHAFVVPINALSQQHQACITSHPIKYAGKLACYRQPLSCLKLEA